MRLKRRVGCFGLFGYDFMIDEEMKVWLIEVNVNPALTTNTNTLLQAIPPVVHESIRESFSSLFLHFSIFVAVISIECFEKIRHNQKIFPLKAMKGYKCIYNELERKNSLPLIEQRRATSSTPNPRKSVPPVSLAPSSVLIPPVPRSPPSPPTSPKIVSRPTESSAGQSNFQRSTISTNARLGGERGKLTRSSDSLLSPLTTTTHSFPTVHVNSNETMVMRYQTIQRYRTNFEILKPATVIAEEWKNLDRTQKDRLAIGGPKALVLVSKSSTPNKQIPALTT